MPIPHLLNAPCAYTNFQSRLQAVPHRAPTRPTCRTFGVWAAASRLNVAAASLGPQLEFHMRFTPHFLVCMGVCLLVMSFMMLSTVVRAGYAEALRLSSIGLIEKNMTSEEIQRVFEWETPPRNQNRELKFRLGGMAPTGTSMGLMLLASVGLGVTSLGWGLAETKFRREKALVVVREAMKGTCGTCGYDRKGLALHAPCPECNASTPI